MATVQQRGCILAWGPQRGAAPWPALLQPVTLPHGQPRLQRQLETLSGSPHCTLPNHPWGGQQSWSQGQGQSCLFLPSKFAKNERRSWCPPIPVLSWGCSLLVALQPLLLTFSLPLLFLRQGMFVCSCERGSPVCPLAVTAQHTPK